jgi:uncharacterized protein (DUF1800 family)
MDRFKSPLAAFLCISLCGSPTPDLAQAAQPQKSPANATTEHPKQRPAYQSNQLHGDERILHALNRFTFGVRPGDLDAVRSEGLEQWFEAQLHPVGLDQTDLNARLAQFPAMQWSPEDLLFRLPTDAIVRQAMDGKAPFPATGALHTVYENELARYQIKKEEKDLKNKQQASTPANAAMAGTAMADASAGAMTTQPEQPALQPVAADSTQGTIIPMAKPAEQPLFDEAQIDHILALPPQQRVVRLVAMKQPEFDSFRKSLKPPQRTALTAGLSPSLKETVAALENPQRLVVAELSAQRLTRDIYSNAQLQEVMTDFWLNHFNVFLHKNGETPYYLVSYERDVIRPHALGKFEDLLEATAHSPAMMLYLDNSSSMGPDSLSAVRAANRPNKQKASEGLNENYARELMELHTLGVNGGYTQADVTQVARVFTGWTVDRPARGGEFRFDENRHEPGTKKVLGRKIKDQGEREGVEVLHMLASSPATANFISRKLAVRFVSDEPPQALVDRMAKAYLTSGGDIPVVLRTLFHSPEFWAADAWRSKVKTPIEFVASAVRACACDAADFQSLENALKGMGMPLYGSVPPTGYSWQSSNWVSAGALVNRMNFALSLAANKMNGISTPWSGQMDSSGLTPAAISLVASSANPAAPDIPTPEVEETRLETMLVPGGVSVSTRSAILEQFAAQQVQSPASVDANASTQTPAKPANPAAAREKQDQLLAGLLLGSPEFQRR